MNHFLNTLFITTHGSYLACDGKALLVRRKKETLLRVPAINLGGVVCFGGVGCSPHALALCARCGIAVTFLSSAGSFRARVLGFTPGNVLLRREQYRRADDGAASLSIARSTLLAKVANARSVIRRTMRDYPDSPGQKERANAASRLSHTLDDVQRAEDLGVLRGLEGDAARTYFSVFNHFITDQGNGFVYGGRSRRPPLDNVNALLSFLYAIVTHDARAACEAAGLDAAVGFLHRDRPGRPGLALDLIEELRAPLCDRLALTLINRRQVQSDGFTSAPNGAVSINDATRKAVLVALQKRKQEEITHPFLNEKMPIGLVVHTQALLLARYLRGELDAYPAFIAK